LNKYRIRAVLKPKDFKEVVAGELSTVSPEELNSPPSS
jgi:hypothetical protein